MAGGILLGIGVVFMSIHKWNESATDNSSNQVAVGSLSLIILGGGLLINSERKLKIAVKRYIELILTPSTNGAGLVCRF